MDEEYEQPKRKVAPKPAPGRGVKTLGEVRLKEIATLKRQGKKPLKVDEEYYTPYFIPERCIVCGRDDLALHERNAGRKCANCLGISGKPVLAEQLSYSYNPNRYLHIPNRLHEEIHRFPHRTLRFAAMEQGAISSPVHPSTMRPDLYPPHQMMNSFQHGNYGHPERTFINYPPACIPSSLPAQTFLTPKLGAPTALVPPAVVSEVAAKSLPGTQDNYLVPQYMRDKEGGKGVRTYGAFGATYATTLSTAAPLPAATFQAPQYDPLPAPVMAPTFYAQEDAPIYPEANFTGAYAPGNYYFPTQMAVPSFGAPMYA